MQRPEDAPPTIATEEEGPELASATEEADESPGLPADQVRLGDQVIRLEPPGSFAVRSEIIDAAGSNWRRGAVAALGACWRGKAPPKTRYERCGYNPLVYGGRVLDELVARGLKASDILAAGAKAVVVITNSLVSEQEVKAAEDFSGASGEGSTG